MKERDYVHAIPRIVDELNTARLSTDADGWQVLCHRCRQHTLHEELLQDPFTRHAFVKSRGYPGDADLMDIIYERDTTAKPKSSIDDLANVTIRWTAAEAVRRRMTFIANEIDRTSIQIPSCNILSVACGHFREAEISEAIQNRQFGCAFGIDQDPLSVDEVNRCYGHLGVTALPLGVAEILKSDHSIPAMDLIYSLGLFDYLQKPQARRLITSLVQMLKPGGRIVIANFMPSLPDIGYMEAVMDWFLIYRTADEMLDLVPAIVREQQDILVKVTTPITHIAILESQRRPQRIYDR